MIHLKLESFLRENKVIFFVAPENNNIYKNELYEEIIYRVFPEYVIYSEERKNFLKADKVVFTSPLTNKVQLIVAESFLLNKEVFYVSLEKGIKKINLNEYKEEFIKNKYLVEEKNIFILNENFNPSETFNFEINMTRKEIAEDISDFTGSIIHENDSRLTDDLCEAWVRFDYDFINRTEDSKIIEIRNKAIEKLLKKYDIKVIKKNKSNEKIGNDDLFFSEYDF